VAPSPLGKEERTMKMFRFAVSFGLIGLLLGCALSPAPPAATTPKLKPFEVKLEVGKNEQGDIVLANKNDKTSNCSKFPNEDKFRKGCIVAEADEIIDVEFKLSGSGGWYFAEFQICSTADTTKKTDFATCGLAAEQTAEWIVLTNKGSGLPGADGKVDISDLGNKPTKFKLLDLNVTKADYFYQVCVKQTDYKCDVPDNCVCTDPGGQNKGRLN
jgi:hypothetical protein